MNSFDHLLFMPAPHAPRREWELICAQSFQVLPLSDHLSFGDCLTPGDVNLRPAIELFVEGEIEAALNFVQMVILAETTQPGQVWRLHLLAVMLLLENGRTDGAWNQLQQGLAVRNRNGSRENESDTQPPIAPREWLVMATAVLAVNDFECAERYASECVAIFDHNPAATGCEILSDIRADAMTIFATIRLSQHRFQEAEMLLQMAYDAYTQAGDMQQLVVVLTLLADIEQLSGSPVSASYLLFEARQILDNECDQFRHYRRTVLRKAIDLRQLDGKLKKTMQTRHSLN